VGNPKTSRKESDVAVTLARPLHVSKVGQSKKGKDQASDTCDFHAHGSRRSLWRFVWRGISIYDVTIHSSRCSRINPTLKVCEDNRVTHASRPKLASVLIRAHLCYTGARQTEEYLKLVLINTLLTYHYLKNN